MDIDKNLTRLNLYAPKLKWKSVDDAAAPEGCRVYVGQYMDRYLTIALPIDTSEAWDLRIQQKLKEDQDRLILITGLSKNINWG